MTAIIRRAFATRLEVFHACVKRNDINCVSQFKDLINARNAQGNSALHHAVKGGAPLGMVQALLKQGANPEIANYEGKTAIQVAKSQEVEDLLHLYAMKQKEDSEW